MKNYTVKVWDFSGGPVAKADVVAIGPMEAAAEASRELGERFWSGDKVEVTIAGESEKDQYEATTMSVEDVRDWLNR